MQSHADDCIWLPDGLRVLLISETGRSGRRGSHLRLLNIRDGTVEAERYLDGSLERLGLAGSKPPHPDLAWTMSNWRIGFLDPVTLTFRYNGLHLFW